MLPELEKLLQEVHFILAVNILHEVLVLHMLNCRGVKRLGAEREQFLRLVVLQGNDQQLFKGILCVWET